MPTSTDSAAQLSIRLLGPVDIRVDDKPLAVDTRKAVALLAYVAVAARPVSRETLAGLLWPDSADAQARGALRRTLSVLTAGLGGAGLAVDRSTVASDPRVVSLDVDRFRSSLARARGHGHPPRQSCSRCRSALEEAVALVRGPFMDGFALRDSDVFEEWSLAEREAHSRELAGALERLVAEQLASSAWDGAIAAARRWLEIDPLHEPAYRALMEAHARSGETAAAVQGYRDAASILDRELGVAPLPETTALYESILAGSFAAAPGKSGRPEPMARPARPGASTLPLIDRDEESVLLERALAESAPDGRLVAIEGEGGIGKSRLADAFTEAAGAKGHTVLSARCYAGEAGIALAPIVNLLRARLATGRDALSALPMHAQASLASLLPELDREGSAYRRAPARQGPAARLALFEAILDVLAPPGEDIGPGSTATILRLDDLQWADDSTLEVLAFVARRLSRRPACVLLSWRREELDERAAPLIGLLAPASLVRLHRLDEAGVRRLVAAAVSSGWPEPEASAIDGLVREAEGLPLYVIEALAAPDRAPGVMPAGIRALLQARLADLSDVASQVTTSAAVIGRSFDAETVRGVSGRSEDETVVALEELVRRGIVRELDEDGATAYDFAHARLRDVAYEAASVARRRLLHRRAAATYRSSTAPERDELGRLARVARHEREAGRSAEAAEAFLEAGELARAVFANREALGYLEAALALGHRDVGALHEAIAEVRTRIGDYPGAIAALEAAAVGAEADRLAGIEHRVARIQLRRGDPLAADAHLAAALAALETDAPEGSPLRAAILADRAIAAGRMGQPDRAADLATEARELADGDVEAEIAADRIAGLLARDRGDLVEAREALTRSLEQARRLEDPIATIAAMNALALLSADAADTEAAIAHAEEALETARRTGERHLEAALENNLADALEAAGRRDDAMDHLKAAAAAFADVGRATGELEPGIWMLESW